MNSIQIAAARKRLEQTPGELAGELGAKADDVLAWEAGRKAVPRRHARKVEWLLAVAEQEAALERAGLPPCEWIEAFEETPGPPTLAGLADHLEEVDRHAAACPVCRAREEYAAAHLPPLPQLPLSGSLRAFGFVGDVLERLPPRLRPATVGALLLGGVVLLRMLLWLPFGELSPARLGSAGVALAAALGAGASGGLAYSAVRPALVKLGAAGDYLTGIACVLAYMGALALASPHAFGEPMAEDGGDWVLLAVLSVLFGVGVGHAWIRPWRLESDRDRTLAGSPGPS